MNIGLSIHGLSIYGEQLARTLDFPTINISSKTKCEPGVYAAITKWRDNYYNSCVYIHPNNKVETHLINQEIECFDNENIEIRLVQFIRSPILFNELSLDQIKKQLQIDKDQCTLKLSI